MTGQEWGLKFFWQKWIERERLIHEPGMVRRILMVNSVEEFMLVDWSRYQEITLTKIMIWHPLFDSIFISIIGQIALPLGRYQIQISSMNISQQCDDKWSDSQWQIAIGFCSDIMLWKLIFKLIHATMLSCNLSLDKKKNMQY